MPGKAAGELSGGRGLWAQQWEVAEDMGEEGCWIVGCDCSKFPLLWPVQSGHLGQPFPPYPWNLPKVLRKHSLYPPREQPLHSLGESLTPPFRNHPLSSLGSTLFREHSPHSLGGIHLIWGEHTLHPCHLTESWGSWSSTGLASLIQG